METVRLATMAMATRFELVVGGEQGQPWLRAAGEEALAEIRRLHDRLSFYSASSDIARINRLASDAPVPVEAGLFRLLQACQRLHECTSGAFDVTVGPLMRCWGFAADREVPPPESEIRDVLLRVGMSHVHLDKEERSVRFDRQGIEIDLGGVGKGYAIDEALWLLRDAGVTNAFLHGGTSSMKAMGDSLDGPGWSVAISAPTDGQSRETSDQVLAVATLRDRALAVSDRRGKWYVSNAEIVGHVIDPRTGRPAGGTDLAVVELESAAEADALSTALLVMTPEERVAVLDRFTGVRTLIASGGSGSPPLIDHSDFPGP